MRSRLDAGLGQAGAVARTQVSQANINAARASVAAICGHNSSAVYVQERHGRDEITVTEGGAAAKITVGLSKMLGRVRR